MTDSEHNETPPAKNRCVRTSEKYWLTSLVDLFTHYTVLPGEYMSLGAKLNSVLRLSVLIFIILLVFNVKLAPLFLILAVSINILFWVLYRHEYD